MMLIILVVFLDELEAFLTDTVATVRFIFMILIKLFSDFQEECSESIFLECDLDATLMDTFYGVL